MTQRAALVLTKARELIDQHGLLQHKGGDPSVGFCTSEAIHYAAYHGGENQGFLTPTPDADGQEARRQVRRYINHGVSTPISIPAWNDQAGRTKEEVTHTLDEVARRVRAE